MKVLWICGLPNIVRLEGAGKVLSPIPTAAWSWILGHLPPPKNIELHILCPVAGLIDSCIDFEYMGVHWHCFKQYRFETSLFWYRFYFQTRGFVKALKPDIIHGWGGETGCGRLATLLTKNAIVSVQGLLLLFWQLSKTKYEKHVDFRMRLLWFCERRTYNKASILLVESEASRVGLEQYYNEYGVLIPHPLRYEFLMTEVTLKNPQKIKFVFLGSLNSRKGPMDAVKAFARIRFKAAELVMIGTGTEELSILQFIEKNDLKSRIRVLGNLPVQKIIDEFRDAQFFLLPSYGDTGPTALKEALAMGIYPICYRNSGPESLINYYKCGRMAETGNIDELTLTIEDCINNVIKCSKEALDTSEFIRKELSRTNVWGKLCEVYAKGVTGSALRKVVYK